ncbi:inner centromere protein A [Scaptodrosophila lebanonensis]|uniref:Inner centromere protein A n=1 Tax=Drosophila lebanonensis TaxID=7225 RepID=A0A6J2TVI2_DROLE|nr:inner centromere protein A [Scaptodrosophila lebanonensis]
MAFVARRNSEGKVVDRVVLTGRSKVSSPLLSLSDEESDAETLQSYSGRTEGAPTVRYTGSHMMNDDCETDVESACIYDCGESIRDTDGESMANYTIRYEDPCCGAVGQDSGYGELESDCENGKCEAEAETDADADVATIKCWRDTKSIASEEERETVTDTETLQLRAELSSLASFESSTVCGKTGLTGIGGSLGNLSTMTPNKLDSVTDQMMNLDLTMGAETSLSRRTYILGENTVRGEYCASPMPGSRRDDCSSTDSTCSWSDMYANAIQHSESRSNFVPSLSLNMSETTSSGTSTYYRALDDDKVERQGQVAYEDWLCRKERQKQQKLLAAKQERERREEEAALRQRLSQERFDAWCKQKTQQKKQAVSGSSSMSSLKSTQKSAQRDASKNKLKGAQKILAKSAEKSTAKSPTNQGPPDPKAHLEEWERLKDKQQQRERERLRKQQEAKMRTEQMRKRKSEMAWENWMKSVQTRPKPVPLNQGLDTLRGTVSNIYINPIEWVSNIDVNDSRGN